MTLVGAPYEFSGGSTKTRIGSVTDALRPKPKRPKWWGTCGQEAQAKLILSSIKSVEPAWESTYLHWISGKKGENPGARGVCIHYFLRTWWKNFGPKRIIGRKEKSGGNIKDKGRFCGGFGLFRMFLQWFTCELSAFYCGTPLITLWF